MKNADISIALYEIAQYVHLTGGTRAQRRTFEAAAALVAGADASLDDDDDALEALLEAVDDDPADELLALLDDDIGPMLTAFRESFPPSLLVLLQVKGLGPSMAQRLHNGGIHDLDALIEAAAGDGLKHIKGIGAKTALKLHDAAVTLAEALKATAEEKNLAHEAETKAADAEPVAEAKIEPVAVEPVAEAEIEPVAAVDVEAEVELIAAVDVEAEVELIAAVDVEAAEAELTAVVDVEAESAAVVDVEAVEKLDAAEAAVPETAAPALYNVEELFAQDVQASPSFASALRCPKCRVGRLVIGPNFGLCPSCQQGYDRAAGILDVVADATPPASPAQRLMEFAPYSRIYEQLARPVLTMTAAGRGMNKELAQTLSLLGLDDHPDTPLSILDVACGTGNFTRRIAEAVASSHGSQVYGLDLSLPMLERAHAYGLAEQLDNITWVRGDSLALPFATESLDRLHCAGAFHLMPHHEQVLAEFERVLRPGGAMVLSTFATGKVQRLMKPLRGLGARLTGFKLFDRERLFEMVDAAGFQVSNSTQRWTAVSILAQKRA